MTLIVGALLAIDGVSSAVLVKRQIGFTGGFSPARIDDKTVKEMADFATTAIAANTNSGPVKLIKLVKAETQVVSGTNYKLQLELAGTGANAESRACEALVFNQPWTNTRKLIRSSCAPLTKSKTSKRQIPGGFSEVDVNDDSVKEMAQFVTTSLSETSNSGPVTLIEVVKAETQVVAGKNYKLTLKFTDASNAEPYTCEAVIFDQSWTKTRELLSSTCPTFKAVKQAIAIEAPADPPSVGGFTDIDVNDEQVQEMAKFATASLIGDSSNSVPVKLVSIVKARVQLVAGKNYEMTLQVSDGENADPYTCEVIIFDQPWTQTREVKKSFCPTKISSDVQVLSVAPVAVAPV